jgi:acyl-CoA thioesterase-2
MQQPIMPENPVSELISVLNLEQIGDNEFRGQSQWMPHGRVFGGQVLAQALAAATATVTDRSAHSMHAYFLRAGDASAPIDFQVERLRDGRSFSSRRVLAIQNELPIFSMISSFQELQDGLQHEITAPAGIPHAETLPSARDLLGKIDHPAAKFWANSRPFDLRHVQPALYLRPAEKAEAQQAVWFKALEPMPDDTQLHQFALAYASDYTILEPIIRRHGLSWAHPGLSSASLDHAIWFHRPTRVDNWLLYVQHSPSATGGRGLSGGNIFDESGALVATVMQEGMLRVPTT